MVAKTVSAQAGVAVGVGATDGLGDEVGDGAAADPHAEPVATASRSIAAGHQRVINCSYIQYGARMRAGPLWEGAWGKGRGSYLVVPEVTDEPLRARSGAESAPRRR